jgi:hypothetical protein
MDEDRLDREMKAVLRARDPGPAPSVLLQRVAAIPDREPVTMAALARRTLSRFAQPVAAAVALVAVAALLLMRQFSVVPAVGPGVGGTSGTVPFDPTIEGAGVYAGSTGFEIIVILLVALTLAFLAIARIRLPALRAVLVGSAVVVGLGAVAIDNYDALESNGIIWYPGVGAVRNTPPDGAMLPEGERPSQAFAVEPSGILTFGFDVHNQGPFPITVLGIVPDRRDLAFGRFTAAGWMGDESGVGTVEPERFAPLTLQPDGYQVLAVAARASPCAVARDTSGDALSAGAGVQEIQVAYEILGIRKVATLQLPKVIRISLDPNCRVDKPITSPSP